MTSASQLPTQNEGLLSAPEKLPTMYDLPSEDPEEPGLPDEFHGWQPQILQLTFKPKNWPGDRVFSAADLNLYYDVEHPLWHKRPDWFGAVGVSRLYEGWDMRLSYVMWQERVSPLIVVELLSPGTEDEDLGQTISTPGKPPTKWQVYEEILRVPYYVVFSRYTDELQVFGLVGDRYQSIALTNGRLLIPEAELSLGLWQGSYQGINRLWLRWFTMEGELILLPTEEAAAAEERAAIAEERASIAEQHAELLRARLLELGIDPDSL